ncbi:MAG: PIN domain-containing protein [Candidatus Firestonebacteria bacterium]|nr:PIN domain-containing protein [Candidatus Firestonebacteria bacterium]
MITAIDTNILLDILTKDKKFYESSKKSLDECLSSGALIINEIVYAELATQFENMEMLDRFIKETQISFVPSSLKALKEAAKTWNEYLKRKNKSIQCPKCGKQVQLFCEYCSLPIIIRQHIISDFLIGAHAKIHSDRLLTRDRGYYRIYFNALSLL